MDTWLPRVTNVFIATAVTLILSIVAWMISVPEKPPVWLLSLAFGFGFAAVVFSHIYNAAHDSMPPD
jgi:hypothetical protein